jgi:carnitine O-octanoyltransferase
MLQKAAQNFQQLMTNACNGLGCDRHLLGLYLTAIENGIEIPEIFIDPSFVKSGGNGNFVLSTSCAGYWNICGSVPPMIESGYSFFYGIEPHQYSFTISSYKTCSETSAESLHKSLHLSLIDMQNILNSKQ